MKKILALLIVVLLTNAVYTKVITKEIYYKPEIDEPHKDTPLLAMLELKKSILSETGIFVSGMLSSSETSINQTTKDLTSKEVTTIIAGVTQITVNQEKWKDTAYYINASANLDESSILEQIDKVAQDEAWLHELKVFEQKAAEASDNISEIKIKLAKAVSDSEKLKLLEDLNSNIVVLNIRDLFDKMYSFELLNQYDNAIATMNEVIDKDPDNADAYNNLGRLNKQQKKEYDKAVQYYRKAIQLNPQESFFYTNLSAVYLEEDYLDNNKVLDLCKQAQILDTKDKENSAAYNNMGAAYINLGNFQEGIKQCQEAITIDPENFNAWQNLANAYLGLNEFSKSEEAANKAIYLSPENPLPYYIMGTIKEAEGKTDQAEQYYKKTISKDKKYAYAYLKLGSMISNKSSDLKNPDLQTEKWKEGFTYTIQGYALNVKLAEQFGKNLGLPDNGMSDSMERYGTLDFNQKEYELAEKFYLKGLEYNPKNIKILIQMGNLYGGQNRITDALNISQKAVNYEPDNADALQLLCELYIFTEDYEQALLYANKAHKLKPRDGRLLYDLGFINEKQKNMDSAIGYYILGAELGEEACKKSLSELGVGATDSIDYKGNKKSSTD
jgi:tetratricopeptide (TPR) repeat protein